ncbi:Negative regulator of mitotic exit [Tulasnella sp. 419]|nr:Negative regulator of mitotic exit [Tulasnella sp. 419]
MLNGVVARSRYLNSSKKSNDLRNDLQTKIQEAESDTSRLTEWRNARAKSHEEVDACRALANGGQLLDSQREMLVDVDRAARGHSEKSRVMKMKEAGVRVDAAQNELLEYTKRLESFNRG